MAKKKKITKKSVKKSAKKTAKKVSAKKTVKKAKVVAKKKASKKKSSAKSFLPIKQLMNHVQKEQFLRHLTTIQNGNQDRAGFEAFLDEFRRTTDQGTLIKNSEFTIYINHVNDPLQTTDIGININRIEPS